MLLQASQVELDKHKSAAHSMITALCNDKRALADDLTAQVLVLLPPVQAVAVKLKHNKCLRSDLLHMHQWQQL